MNISFENKVALVTGAGSGLGLATAEAFAEAGASVALADWNENAVRSAADKLVASGHKALAIRCDVSSDAEVQAMVCETIATFGGLDIAYNNAGVQNEIAETADTTAKDYDRVMRINLRGIYHAAKHGVLGFTKSAALEYAPKGIRINAVCPGLIHTPSYARSSTTRSGACATLSPTTHRTGMGQRDQPR